MLRILKCIAAFIVISVNVNAQFSGDYEKRENGVISKLTLKDSLFNYSEFVVGSHGAFHSNGEIKIEGDTLVLVHQPYVLPDPIIDISKRVETSGDIAMEIYSLDSTALGDSDIFFLKNDEVIAHQRSNLKGGLKINFDPAIYDEIAIGHVLSNSELIIHKSRIPEDSGKIKVYLPVESADSYNRIRREERFLINGVKLISLDNGEVFFERIKS
ncbi:hypothetical protein [Robertkochia aurantiaca]|uniref:hypothetical protein n=1 Tax=Robertkochia aurantiaca TaxID=2873700 RepID=UPI001CCFD78D|nr:hypothetical protein [Robertkochia sp. 3YJGBD-33]